MKLNKAELDSPDRCKSIKSGDQCPYVRVAGSDYCALHGGNRAADKANKDTIRNLRLTKWKAQIVEQASSTEIFSLRDEVGVLRVVLQEILNSCENSSELMQRSQIITELVTKVDKLVGSCFTIESKLANFLTQEQLAELADNIINIIGIYVDDPNKLDAISEDIVTICTNVPSNVSSE